MFYHHVQVHLSLRHIAHNCATNLRLGAPRDESAWNKGLLEALMPQWGCPRPAAHQYHLKMLGRDLPFSRRAFNLHACLETQPLSLEKDSSQDYSRNVSTPYHSLTACQVTLWTTRLHPRPQIHTHQFTGCKRSQSLCKG